ncbi:unnamed protein product [Peniophora sp. CBMAI 1063]|nr:unnamed protein product [Peniophora sp. CBMAI 1063]
MLSGLLLATKKALWPHALKHAVYLHNRLPHSSLGHLTPYEVAFGIHPNLNMLFPWGSMVWVKLRKGLPKKLGDMAVKAHFAGVSDESKGWEVLWPGTRKITTERNVYMTVDDVLRDKPVGSVGGDDGEDDDLSPEFAVSKPAHIEPVPAPVVKPPADKLPPPAAVAPHAPLPALEKIDEVDEEEDKDEKQEVEDDLHLDSPLTTPPASPKVHARQTADCEITSQPLNPELGRVAEIIGEVPSGMGFTSSEVDPTVVAAAARSNGLPRTLTEALKLPSPKCELWDAGAGAEYGQLDKQKVFKYVDEATLPPGTQVLGTRNVLLEKRNEKGEVTKLKVWMVMQGHLQSVVIGDHTIEVFTSILKPSTMCMIFAHGATQDWVFWGLDIRNAYLHAPMTDTVYVRLPELYEKHNLEYAQLIAANPGMSIVAQLLKALYGTKQAGRLFYKHLHGFFVHIGFVVCGADEAVFVWHSASDAVIAATATDDLTCTAPRESLIEYLIACLLHVVRDREARTVSLGQQAYAHECLKRMGMADAKPLAMPLEPGLDLTPGAKGRREIRLSECSHVLYRMGVGLLMYLVIMTRPDLCFAVNTLSQYLDQPTKTHMDALKHAFHYLAGTIDYCLVLGGRSVDGRVIGWCDSDWATQAHRHSISGYAFFLGHGAITWSSKKQTIIALSSTEAEYVALTHAARELLWLCRLVLKLFPEQAQVKPNVLHCDNQGAGFLAKDPVYHARSKHIEIRYHFIRQIVELGKAVVKYVTTDKQVADGLTKSLKRDDGSPGDEGFEGIKDLGGFPSC